MRTDLTDITVIMDRSGSMSSVRAEAESGLNAFIKDQQARPGQALFTLLQFDTDYEFVHRAVPIVDVGHCALVPRGMTALLDAVGRGVNETGERLKAMKDDERPGLVVFVIVTDGGENSSHEFTKEQVKAQVTEQQTKYGWQFTYLGANVDAFAEAANLGVAAAAASGYAPQNSPAMYMAASASVGRMRSASASGETIANMYTEEERKKMTQV